MLVSRKFLSVVIGLLLIGTVGCGDDPSGEPGQLSSRCDNPNAKISQSAKKLGSVSELPNGTYIYAGAEFNVVLSDGAKTDSIHITEQRTSAKNTDTNVTCERIESSTAGNAVLQLPTSFEIENGVTSSEFNLRTFTLDLNRGGKKYRYYFSSEKKRGDLPSLLSSIDHEIYENSNSEYTIRGTYKNSTGTVDLAVRLKRVDLSGGSKTEPTPTEPTPDKPVDDPILKFPKIPEVPPVSDPAGDLPKGVDENDVGSVSGTFYAPNGSDPISNGLVYVPVKGNEDVDPGFRNKKEGGGNCGTPSEAYFVMTCTLVTGNYVLNSVPAGFDVKIVFKKGTFKVWTRIKVSVGYLTQVKKEDSTLPSQNTDKGSVANILVVKGAYDNLEKVLLKLGMDRSSFKVSHSLPSDFAKYDMIMFNCGCGEENSIVNSPSTLKKLRDYVEAGGRVYATDRAYDIVERLYPSAIDFEGIDKTQNAAEKGNGGITVNAVVNGTRLRNWLRARGALRIDDKVEIQGFGGGWAKMTSSGGGTTEWVSVDRPLTVTFLKGKGKVFYSSYHTFHEGDPNEVYPQEKILQYLVFEMVD